MDLRKLKTLLQLMDEHGLGEMEIDEEGSKIRLRKNASGVPTIVAAPAAPAAQQAAPSAAAKAASADPAAPAPQAKPKENLHEIKSPIVGTFYRSPSPTAEPFMKVGQKVSKDSVLCIIEAMKVMNEIKSDVSGIVDEILLENGQPVEYGQVMMRIRI